MRGKAGQASRAENKSKGNAEAEAEAEAEVELPSRVTRRGSKGMPERERGRGEEGATT